MHAAFLTEWLVCLLEAIKENMLNISKSFSERFKSCRVEANALTWLWCEHVTFGHVTAAASGLKDRL